jgi:hypothetical protein
MPYGQQNIKNYYLVLYLYVGGISGSKGSSNLDENHTEIGNTKNKLYNKTV